MTLSRCMRSGRRASRVALAGADPWVCARQRIPYQGYSKISSFPLDFPVAGTSRPFGPQT